MKAFLFFIFGGVLGAIAGAGGMLIAFPYIFPPPVVNEKVDAQTRQSLLVSTEFREGVAGQDAGHWGRGAVKIYRGEEGKIVVELQGDFEVGPGPNFWLYLNSKAGINTEDDFYKDGERKKITKLKSFTGSQVYQIEEADYQTARSLTIWCESFGQYIASADL